MTTPAPGLPVGRTASGQILLSHYRNNQQAIATRVALAIQNLWHKIIDPAKFDESWHIMNPIANGIISTHQNMAAADAAQYYANSRVMAGFPHIHVPGLPVNEDYIDKVVNIMGRGQFYHFLKEQDEAAASSMAADALRGSSTRLVLNGGRETVVRASGIDPMAIGWERIIEPGACSFCAMLAGRGGVYKESTVNFRAHDHCHCVGRPVFKGQSSVNRDLSDKWGEVTKGTRGAAARAAWDRYWSSHGGPETTTGSTEKGAGPASVEDQSIGRAALSHSAANRS
jgi:hypothetical protein